MKKPNQKHAEDRISILVVDGTGRGHAICDLFIRTDPDVTVFYGPGCDVIEHDRIVTVQWITLDDPQTVLDFLRHNPVEFIFVSNIDALSKGYVDVLRAHGHRVIGPTMAAARLEASKERGKRFCVDHAIPTAPYRFFTDAEAAKDYIRALPYACVVKTDGLCPDGDGAIVCGTADEAQAAVDGFARAFGAALRVVVEKRLHGQEISVFALLDGDSYLMFPTALDFKRTLENDAGKNCDGMGSVAPHPADSPALREEIRKTLLEPLMRGLRADGLEFSGFIYVGAMLTDSGLNVIEINARFGDSEAEAVLPSVRSNFTQLCRAILARDLPSQRLVTDDLVRCTIALTQGCLDPSDPQALPGWPFGSFCAGQKVSGLDAIDRRAATLMYANLRKDVTGQPITSGGRVLHVVGAGRSLAQALDQAYGQIGRIAFRGMRYRSDIGAKLLGQAPAHSVKRLSHTGVNVVLGSPLGEARRSRSRVPSRGRVKRGRRAARWLLERFPLASANASCGEDGDMVYHRAVPADPHPLAPLEGEIIVDTVRNIHHECD